MARIVFFVWPNIGSQIASMKLAADLRDRGHSICYMGLQDSEDYIKSHGFEFITVFKAYFPIGFLRDQKKLAVQSLGLEYFWMLRKTALHFKGFFDDLLQGKGEEDFLEPLKRIQPDIIVYASGVPEIEWVALLAHSLGIKGVYFHDMLTPCEDLGFPPKISSFIPSAMPWSRIRLYLEWRYYHLLATVTSFMQVAYLAANGIYFGNISKKLADRYRYCRSIQDATYTRERLLRLPELVSFPEDFELPGIDMPGRYYIGNSIYLKRNEPDFPWDKLEQGRPLIYCAVGAVLSHGEQKIKNFFRLLIDASSIRPDWQWVLAIGDSLDAAQLEPIPPHVIVISHAPQLELLQRATMVITHGGANTIKECLHFGVPMIVITAVESPLALTEIPAYAARVAYHGLGVVKKLGNLNAQRLKTLIDAVDKDFYIRSQTKIMQAKCKAVEEQNLGIKLIETILG